MIRLSTAAALASVLLLGACASDAPIMSEKRPAQPPGGLWEVAAALAVEPMGTAQSPYLGQRVALYANSAGDPVGRLCRNPTYLGYEAPPTLVLGSGEDIPRPVLEVICEGEPFGTYVGSADGALRTLVNSWLLVLNRAAEPQPLQITAPQPEPVAPPVAAEPPAAQAAPAASGTLVYLASYPSEAKARRDWTRLAKASPILARQEPRLQSLDLGKKGHWVRVYALAADEAERTTLCKQLGKLVDECGARNRE